MGAYDSWGAGLLPLKINASDVYYYNIDSISIHTLYLDRNLDGMIFNSAFCVNTIDFMNNDLGNVIVYGPFRIANFINKKNDDFVYITIKPKQNNISYINYEMNNLTRFIVPDNFSNNIEIRIYSPLYFASQEDVDRFILGHKGNIAPSNNFSIYPKPSVDTTAFLARNTTSYTIQFRDYE